MAKTPKNDKTEREPLKVMDLSASDPLDLIEMDEAIGKLYAVAGALLKMRNHKASERTPVRMRELAEEAKEHADKVLKQVA